eukprot:TRINITY_DN1443_c0_g2_i1.p1 TRINITY_DN1443_c0_g2~~TRINITY_DN1443_c0_g2_i1.p1  ORF type:complete len:1477 (+),score=323.44 TRINITY_DN1443_c0_g2_i1:73-4431(+)
MQDRDPISTPPAPPLGADPFQRAPTRATAAGAQRTPSTGELGEAVQVASEGADSGPESSHSDQDEADEPHRARQPTTPTSLRGRGRPARSVVTSEALDQEDDREGLSCRERTNLLFSDPTSSLWARVVSGFFMLLILLSTATFLLETVPKFSSDKDYGDPARACMWFVIESIFIAFFSFEYFVRWATEPWETIGAFPVDPFNIVDLIAIAPFYLELVASGFKAPCGATSEEEDDAGFGLDLRFIRVVRLARVFRVMKLGRNLDATRVLTKTFSRSREALMVPFFFLLLGMIVFSSLIYLVEQGDYRESEDRYFITDSQGHEAEAVYPSIPDSLWWALVTMTTVGYGDVTPRTALGKAINSMAMMFGVLFFAMPIAIVGAEFTKALDDQAQRAQMRQMQRVAYAGSGSLRELQSTTKQWGGDELNVFNIAFSERNLTLEQFLGFDEAAADCRISLNSSDRSTPGDDTAAQSVGLMFKFESAYHSGMPPGSTDDGIILAKVECENPVVVKNHAGRLVGRRLLSLKTGPKGSETDFTQRDAIEEWVQRNAKGDHGSWANSLAKQFAQVVFQFETEKQVGDRITRLAPAESLVPQHFNTSLFRDTQGNFQEQLAVPRSVKVVSQQADIHSGVYELQAEQADHHFKWLRRDDLTGAAEPRTRGAASASVCTLQSSDGRWAVQRRPCSRSEAGGAEEDLRTQERHCGNLPSRRFVWERRSTTPRHRWVSCASTFVRPVPTLYKVVAGDAPHLSGEYRVQPLLCGGRPQWMRDDPDGACSHLYFKDDPRSCGRWVIAQRQPGGEEHQVIGAVLRCGEVTGDRLPDRATNWEFAEGLESGWDLGQDYTRIAWKMCFRRPQVREIETPMPIGVPGDSLTNLANKIFHLMRAVRQAEDPKIAEKNINMYTKDFICQMFHHVGIAQLPTGFRSRAGLKVYFGSPETCDLPREFHSDSDLGVFGIAPGKVVPVYVMANQALLPGEKLKKGRIAGELLAVAQNFWLLSQNRDCFHSAVFLITFRGTLVRFYRVCFSDRYLHNISQGDMPGDDEQVTVYSFPNRKESDKSGARYDCIRRTADETFPRTRREAADMECTHLEWKMYPQKEIQDGKLQYLSMPRLEDYGGSTCPRVVAVNPSYHGGIKVGMRMLRIEDIAKKQSVVLSCRADYEKFVRERASHDQLDTINVRATVAEDNDGLDFLNPPERAVIIEMLQRIRVRVTKYLVDEFDEAHSFSPNEAFASRKRITERLASQRPDVPEDGEDPVARPQRLPDNLSLPQSRSRSQVRSVISALGESLGQAFSRKGSVPPDTAPDATLQGTVQLPVPPSPGISPPPSAPPTDSEDEYSPESPSELSPSGGTREEVTILRAEVAHLRSMLRKQKPPDADADARRQRPQVHVDVQACPDSPACPPEPFSPGSAAPLVQGVSRSLLGGSSGSTAPVPATGDRPEDPTRRASVVSADCH